MNALTPFDMLIDAVADRVVEKLAPMIAQQPAVPTTDPDELWDRSKVAGFLGIATSTLDERRRDGTVPPPVDRPGRPVWLAGDIIAYAKGLPKRGRQAASTPATSAADL